MAKAVCRPLFLPLVLPAGGGQVAGASPGTQKEAIEVDSLVRRDAAALQRTIRELRSTYAAADSSVGAAPRRAGAGTSSVENSLNADARKQPAWPTTSALAPSSQSSSTWEMRHTG